jgi:hypothetical protein
LDELFRFCFFDLKLKNIAYAISKYSSGHKNYTTEIRGDDISVFMTRMVIYEKKVSNYYLYDPSDVAVL